MPRDENRAADGVAIVILLIGWYGGLEVGSSVEEIVAHELVDIAVKAAGT